MVKGKEEMKKKTKLDKKWFPMCGASGYHVEYYVFRKPKKGYVKCADDAKKHPYISKTHVCFSGLSNALSDFFRKHSKPANRILYCADFKKHNNSEYHVKKEMREWWVRMCRKYGLMPKSIGKHFIETGNFLFNPSDMDINQMYVCLTSARMLQEQPGMVISTYNMVEKGGIDFFAALIISHRVDNTNTGHSLIDIGRAYNPSHNDIEQLGEMDISSGLGLVKFVKGHHEPKFVLKDFKAGKSSLGSFCLQQTCRKLNGKTENATVSDLLTMKLSDQRKKHKAAEAAKRIR
jgi:hypothetical protein